METEVIPKVPLIKDQEFKAMSQWGHSHPNHHKSESEDWAGKKNRKNYLNKLQSNVEIKEFVG